MAPPSDLEGLFDPSSRKSVLKDISDNPKVAEEVEDYDLFFSHIQTTCERADRRAMGGISSENVLECFKAFWSIADTKTIKKETFRDELKGLPWMAALKKKDNEINNIIDFVLRIWLTINIRDSKLGRAMESIPWKDNTALEDFVKDIFDKLATAATSRELVLDKKFSALALHDCGVQVQITYDLRHHLNYDHNEKILLVYPLRLWLEVHKNSNQSVIPRNVIEDTLKSLAILFPPGPETEKFLRSIKFEGQPGNDYPFDPPPSDPQLQDFSAWRDRLYIVYSVFESPTELQLLQADFKKWFGFWGAAVSLVVMTAVFGILTVVFTILSYNDVHKTLTLAIEAASSIGTTCLASCTQPTVTVSPVRF